MKKRTIRRQKVLMSKFGDELFRVSGVNQVYRCFELVGIYESFHSFSKVYVDFKEFYTLCHKEEKYHYRNVGVQKIYELIEDRRNNHELGEANYEISKSSMRRYGITYENSRVRVYESSAVVLEILLDYIMSREEMVLIYNDEIKKDTMIGYFDFQEKCLEENEGGIITFRMKLFSGIRLELAKIIGVKTK